ncbi:putative dynamin-related protein [Cryptosporidium canis]|uniref:Dynamin-related protein n=1 Tax=Cryptosporidium canis TaxID=195482 RepID=A0ABQ8P4L0_9CRYT|nr:putative dynamin-related protein [Cryptosporidium canis]KAJ1608060.1 putative dynamin-related protein [Cryptosporidium canis]
MDSLIPVINELHDVLTVLREGSGGREASEELSLELPEIAVVGSQSVGKSSLLEYIIGRHILPRGQGIVTRRPLILQLQQLRQDSRDDYAEFGHKKGLKFTDFEKVREEIQAETTRLLGDNKNVSDVPIVLRIFSKKAIGLTLVDLPGLTKVPIEDQPNDIESQIRKIVLSYIRRPSCLILAITAANTDIANSDSLNIAREVDPEGSRTIGVLSRGYVGVMCRDSRQRTGGPRSLRASLNEERSFFENNSKLKAFQSRCGTYNLVNILQREFLDHILRLLPRIKSQSKRLIELKQAELLNYGDSSRSDILDEIDKEASQAFPHLRGAGLRRAEDAGRPVLPARAESVFEPKEQHDFGGERRPRGVSGAHKQGSGGPNKHGAGLHKHEPSRLHRRGLGPQLHLREGEGLSNRESLQKQLQREAKGPRLRTGSLRRRLLPSDALRQEQGSAEQLLQRPARAPKALSRLDGAPPGVGEHCGRSKPQASGGPPAEPQHCGLGPQGHHVLHGERRQGRDPERAGGQAVQGGDLRRSAPGGEGSCREETAVSPEYQPAV